MTKPGPKPRRTNIEWSPELAYAVGLIATDGCLYNDGRHISLVSKDVEQLKTFLKCIGREDVRIAEKTGGYRKRITHAQFSDSGLYAFLVAIGLTPNKTKTMGALKIPREYFWDFVRGLFDGDGCSYSFYDSVYKKSYRFYISFASASPSFIRWLRTEIERIGDITGHVNLSRERNYMNLKYAKSAAVVLTKFMYHHPGVPSLSRKRTKVLESLRAAETTSEKLRERRKRVRVGQTW